MRAGALPGATLAVLVATGSAIATGLPPLKPPVPAPVKLEPCDIAGLEGKARCGTYEVFENRQTRTGRKIPLTIVILPATGPNRLSDPFIFLNGGPGESSTEPAPWLAREFSRLRQQRDILLVDQRGTGGSHPLNCEMFLPADDLQSYLGEFFPLEDVRRCRAKLEQDADLGLYTTSIGMDDLDDVRAALGYDRLNLYGGSYGTRAALVYLRQHPDHVRSVLLEGVVPTNDRMPLPFPRGAERALTGVLAECAAEAACNAAFPNIGQEEKSVFARLSRAPVTVSVLHPDTARPASVSLSRDLAAEAIRYMLYSSGNAREVPAVLHQAAQGDFTPLAELALFGRQRVVATGSTGMYLSVTCAEDLPWILPGEGERAAEGTFLGDYRLRQQRAACALWPRGRIPEGYLDPVQATAPVLLLSGMWDPTTPPSNAEAVAKHLPNSLQVVIPHGAHNSDGLEGLDCVKNLQIAFVESGSVKGLDTRCVERIRRPPFRTEPMEMKVVPLSEADLARFAGRYVEEAGSLEVEGTLEAGRLVLTIPGERRFVLAPVAQARFRVAGAPSLAVSFDVADGAVRRATLTDSGNPVLTLVPKTSPAKN